MLVFINLAWVTTSFVSMFNIFVDLVFARDKQAYRLWASHESPFGTIVSTEYYTD